MNSIVPNPFQPRSEFDDAGIASLADSLEQVGVLQPILVRPDCDGAYQLISGERRWRAAQQAGLTVIPSRSIISVARTVVTSFLMIFTTLDIWSSARLRPPVRTVR